MLINRDGEICQLILRILDKVSTSKRKCNKSEKKTRRLERGHEQDHKENENIGTLEHTHKEQEQRNNNDQGKLKRDLKTRGKKNKIRNKGTGQQNEKRERETKKKKRRP